MRQAKSVFKFVSESFFFVIKFGSSHFFPTKPEATLKSLVTIEVQCTNIEFSITNEIDAEQEMQKTLDFIEANPLPKKAEMKRKANDVSQLSDSSSSSCDSSSSSEEEEEFHKHQPNAKKIKIAVDEVPDREILGLKSEYKKQMVEMIAFVDSFHESLKRSMNSMLDKRFFNAPCGHVCAVHPAYKKVRGRPVIKQKPETTKVIKKSKHHKSS